MLIQLSLSAKFLLGFCLLILYCEYIIYNVYISKCEWPILDPFRAEGEIPSRKPEIRALFVGEVHLYGPGDQLFSHKIRDEWQILRAFQTAVNHLKPDIIFFLGDLFNDGVFCDYDNFVHSLEKFKNKFKVPKEIIIHVVPGNRDIGYTQGILNTKKGLFNKAFNTSDVRFVQYNDNIFILLNFAVLEDREDCKACQEAKTALRKIERALLCAKNSTYPLCDFFKKKLPVYSKPIIIQHMPLYRKSDTICKAVDDAPIEIKYEQFKPKDVLSEAVTKRLLRQLQPRLVFSSNTHHGCVRNVSNTLEITVPNLNKRFKANPNIGMGVFKSNNFAYRRCILPSKYDIKRIYATGTFFLIIYVLISEKRKNKKFEIEYENLNKCV